MGSELFQYDRELKKKIGATLLELSMLTNELSLSTMEDRIAGTIAAVVPITSGLGIISGFSEVVATIISHLGFQIFVTSETDVTGILEAQAKGADWIFMADDKRFIGIDTIRNRIAENDRETARGYVEALNLCAGGLDGREVLVLGCGRVGREAIKMLLKKNAIPTIYDKLPDKMTGLSGIHRLTAPSEIKNFELVFDATNEGDWLDDSLLHNNAWIASPGIPLSLNPATEAMRKNKLIHDQLQIGVAAMVGELCR